MPGPLWVTPLCDRVLFKVYQWLANYTRGEVYATCKFNDPRAGVVDKPTAYAHRIAWTKQEFDHFLRIMEASCDNKVLVEELKTIRDKVLPKGQLVLGPGAPRAITMSFYPEYVKLMYMTLLEAKNGKPKSMEDFREDGKGLFE